MFKPKPKPENIENCSQKSKQWLLKLETVLISATTKLT